MNPARIAANAPASVKGFLGLARSILFESSLDPRKGEIAVLRVKHARYE